MHSTWAEDRARWGSNPSDAPGAETEWGGTMPPSSIGIGSVAHTDFHSTVKALGALGVAA